MKTPDWQGLLTFFTPIFNALNTSKARSKVKIACSYFVSSIKLKATTGWRAVVITELYELLSHKVPSQVLEYMSRVGHEIKVCLLYGTLALLTVADLRELDRFKQPPHGTVRGAHVAGTTHNMERNLCEHPTERTKIAPASHFSLLVLFLKFNFKLQTSGPSKLTEARPELHVPYCP